MKKNMKKITKYIHLKKKDVMVTNNIKLETISYDKFVEIHKDSRDYKKYEEEVIDKENLPYHKYLIEKDLLDSVDLLSLNSKQPFKTCFIDKDKNKKSLNLYNSPFPKDDFISQSLPIKIILKHLDKTLYKRDKDIFLDYLAYMVQNHGSKIDTVLVIHGFNTILTNDKFFSLIFERVFRKYHEITVENYNVLKGNKIDSDTLSVTHVKPTNKVLENISDFFKKETVIKNYGTLTQKEHNNVCVQLILPNTKYKKKGSKYEPYQLTYPSWIEKDKSFFIINSKITDIDDFEDEWGSLESNMSYDNRLNSSYFKTLNRCLNDKKQLDSFVQFLQKREIKYFTTIEINEEIDHGDGFGYPKNPFKPVENTVEKPVENPFKNDTVDKPVENPFKNDTVDKPVEKPIRNIVETDYRKIKNEEKEVLRKKKKKSFINSDLFFFTMVGILGVIIYLAS